MTDGRTTMNFIFRSSSNSITWFLKKQPTLAISSFKVEYIRLSNASNEVV